MLEHGGRLIAAARHYGIPPADWLDLSTGINPLGATPEASLAPFCERDGLIVLRSLGKFFGLPGARVGFVMAGDGILMRLREALGPWTVPGPSRWLARRALADTAWQDAARPRLATAGERLALLLAAHGHGAVSVGENALAAVIADRLARRGILVRRFHDPPSLRFGLPGREVDWARLTQVLPEAVA